MSTCAHIIGAGLAGCEAAYQLAKRGISVRLHEWKPEGRSAAHKSEGFAELVCSNSLRSGQLHNAVGLLKAEMRELDSLIMRAADETRVPAGGALAVDRDSFSRYVTAEIENNELIEVIRGEVAGLSTFEGEMLIIASGPLTSDKLAHAIRELTGQDYLYFFDAAAPIVAAESVDMNHAFHASRYGRGDADDYVNCPMTKEEYDDFYSALTAAQCAEIKEFERGSHVFEGCMPIETMASRGYETMRYGPLKPKGLTDPRTGQQPYAVVQLRKENRVATMYNLVGFQTHLKFPEQKRVFSLIPALHEAEFLRYGVMHRNTFLDAPRLLDEYYRLKARPRIRFAGQITGVEGYVESASSGLMCGLFAACELLGKPLPVVNDLTASGALCVHVSGVASGNYQPMNVNFGIMRPLEEKVKGKEEKNLRIAQRALDEIARLKGAIGEGE